MRMTFRIMNFLRKDVKGERAASPARSKPRSGCGAPRQAHREDRTLARLACHGYIAAHHAREFARQRKAETRAAKLLRGRGISLAELLEQLRLMLRRHANAGIDHR